ncbi:MAG: aminotransferase class III-fold pyridoxal phosphate-dependent enzyme, partial [Deltaproteobacteria bacterium]|nr:aminotransferase class III-fold pyridoxal phosphate-dependent enzyme [Deltaproteobacteria bacterium]
QPLLFDVRRLPFPGGRGEEQTLAAFEAILKQEGGRVAALIVEPLVLGSGGMLTWGADILAKLAEMCRRYGVLWIADEVMTGFGRTGTLFAVEQSMALGGPPPDLMCLSKGITGGFMALGATLASEEIFQSFASPDRRRMLFHGHSYTGNPLACSAALASLELFARENTLDRVASIAAIHRKELARLAGHPKVSGVRQAGSIGVVEIMAADGGYLNDMAPKLAEFYLSRNVLLRPLGNVVYLLPPYCITPDELTLAYGVLHESLESVL